MVASAAVLEVASAVAVMVVARTVAPEVVDLLAGR